MNLKNKNAVIYGAGGSIGGAVAGALAGAGARVFLTGLNLGSLQKTADKILASGGNAEVAVVDALDGDAVDSHLEELVRTAGGVDISFNAVGINMRMNVPLVELSAEEFVSPITTTMRTRFLTARAAGKAMMKQRSGVILTLTATPGGIGYPYNGGFAAACCAVENFSANLAGELGIYGIRVVNIRSGGSPDSAVFRNATDRDPELMAGVIGQMENDTMLKKLPPMGDIANVAAFLASDLAASITGVTVDVTCGTTAGLNYRVGRV